MHLQFVGIFPLGIHIHYRSSINESYTELKRATFLTIDIHSNGLNLHWKNTVLLKTKDKRIVNGYEKLWSAWQAKLDHPLHAWAKLTFDLLEHSPIWPLVCISEYTIQWQHYPCQLFQLKVIYDHHNDGSMYSSRDIRNSCKSFQKYYIWKWALKTFL
jgi:hypothetical protein